MTVMLNLPPEKEARLIAAAQSKGLSTDALVREALDQDSR
jgi:predicted HicB family RNase H-like nuclease